MNVPVNYFAALQYWDVGTDASLKKQETENYLFTEEKGENQKFNEYRYRKKPTIITKPEVFAFKIFLIFNVIKKLIFSIQFPCLQVTLLVCS